MTCLTLLSPVDKGIVEPTVVPPVLLDLCQLMILHRFTSKLWWDHVASHAAADVDDKNAFDKIVNLEVRA